MSEARGALDGEWACKRDSVPAVSVTCSFLSKGCLACVFIFRYFPMFFGLARPRVSNPCPDGVTGLSKGRVAARIPSSANKPYPGSSG
jgi:hypothetical protein